MLWVVPVSSSSKVSVLNRVAGKVVDLALVIGLAAILPRPLGAFLGFFYSLAADGMNFGPFSGQSLGKRLMGLQVVHIKSRKPIGLRESFLRNTPVGVATFFAIIPVWGWLILGLIGLPLMIMEVYLMVSIESGRRLGDVMGDTEVVEMKREPTKWPASGPEGS